jgi:hypothetical protein
LIINNGLLATAAFAKEGKEGIQSVINAIEAHLQHEEIAIMPIGKSMMDWLSSEQTDSSTLRRVTAESLAYLNYLRRFVQKGKNHGQRIDRTDAQPWEKIHATPRCPLFDWERRNAQHQSAHVALFARRWTSQKTGSGLDVQR